MADYPPPTQNLPTFNPADFVFSTDTGLTLAEAKGYFLEFPNAQGTENLADVNVSGTLTSTLNSHNLGFGYQALSAVAGSAIDNTAFGFQALKALTLGDSNVAIGDLALPILTGTSALTLNNTAVGHQAGRRLLEGTDNTLVGFNAGSGTSSHTGSNFNTCIGSNAGKNIATSTYNTIVGAGSGGVITTGASNTIIGGGSCALTTGGNNTLVGALSGVSLTTGTDNVIMGVGAGAVLATGLRNTLIGGDTKTSLSGTTDAVVIGYGSIGGVRTTCVGTEAKNGAQGGISIGYLAGASTISGTRNIVIGESAGTGTTSGSRNICLGYLAGGGIITGSNNTCLGSGAECGSSSLTYATAIGADSTTSTSNSITIGRVNTDTVRLNFITPIYTTLGNNVGNIGYTYASPAITFAIPASGALIATSVSIPIGVWAVEVFLSLTSVTPPTSGYIRLQIAGTDHHFFPINVAATTYAIATDFSTQRFLSAPQVITLNYFGTNPSNLTAVVAAPLSYFKITRLA